MLMWGCREHQKEVKDMPLPPFANISIIEIDSCEYVITGRYSDYSGGSSICHKGNCKYCERRRK